MKTIKLLLVMLIFTFAGCNKPEPPTGVFDTIKISSNVIKFDKSGGTKSLTTKDDKWGVNESYLLSINNGEIEWEDLTIERKDFSLCKNCDTILAIRKILGDGFSIEIKPQEKELSVTLLPVAEGKREIKLAITNYMAFFQEITITQE